MDLLDYILYTLGRIGLLIMLVLFGAFMGEIFFPGIVSFLPYSAVSVKEFFTDSTVQSAVALAVICFFFIWLFYDDGKRHTAYEDFSVVNICIVLLIMMIIYFIPSIFRDSFHQEGKADVFYMILYYPCSWADEFSQGSLQVNVVLTSLIIIVISFASYLIAYKRYVKKHPVIVEERKVIEYDDEEE